MPNKGIMKTKYSIKFTTKIQSVIQTKLQDVSVYFMSTCDNMKHTTGITDVFSISNMV